MRTEEVGMAAPAPEAATEAALPEFPGSESEASRVVSKPKQAARGPRKTKDETSSIGPGEA
jgi:hypothetical protein